MTELSSMAERKQHSMVAPHDILIVDDEVEIIHLLRDILIDEGYEVRTARNGAEALRSVASTFPALVLLDYSLPDMTGAEVLRRLRGAGHDDLPVVMMSAGTRVEAMRLPGIAAFLAKPFDLDAVIGCVQRILPFDGADGEGMR